MPRPEGRTASRLLIFSCLLLCPALAAHAQPAPDGRKVSGRELMKMGIYQGFDELSLEDLLTPTETVAVGSRLPETVARTPGTVTLLKADDIRRLGARTLEDALRLLPGVDITVDRLGRSKISLRGVANGFTGGVSEGVLVLLNGERLNESVLGGAGTLNLSLSADHVRQVELLRGPGSALYGDGALTGVVSIVLQSTDDFMGTEILAGGGSFGTQDYTIRSGAIFKRLQISGFVRFLDSNGAQSTVRRDAQSVADLTRLALDQSPISLAPGPATDGYRTIETAYRLVLDEWSLGFRSRSDGWDGLVGWADALGKQNSLATRQTNIDLAWKREAAEMGTIEARLSFTQNQIRQILEIYPSGYTILTPSGDLVEFGKPHSDGGVFLDESLGSRRYQAEGLWSRDLSSRHRLNGGLTFGVEKTHDLQADSNLDFRTSTPVPGRPEGGLGYLVAAVANSRRSVFGAFLQDQWTPSSRMTLTTGLRFDHYWGVGGIVSPRIALTGSFPSWFEKKLPTALGTGLGYKLLYGRSFRVPTFSELYFSLPGYTGNPDLRPVVADSVEAGFNYKSRRWQAALTGYLNLVDRTIETGEPFDPVGTALLRNGPGVKVLGVEVEVRKGFGVTHSLFANYAYQHAEARDGTERAAEVPAHLANFGVSLLFRERYGLTSTLQLRSERPRAPFDLRRPTEGSAVLGLSGRVDDLANVRGLGVDVLVDDVFDQEVLDPAPLVPGDYPRPGRRFLAHLSYRF